VVGGAEESLLASPQTNDLLLGKRKGFVKLALRQGASLVPVFGFGETNVYQNLATNRPSLQRILLKIQKVLGFALPAIGGRGWFNYNWGPLPFRCPIVTVVGAPIALPKIAQPSQEEIEHWHAVYMEALLELYRENKDVYDVYCSTQARVVR
jgi:2-acylglycerol O-acyltransferase 2